MGAISCLTNPLSAKILLATDFHSYPNPILDLETGVLLSFDGPIPDRHSGPAKRQLRGQTSEFVIDKTEAILVLSRADIMSPPAYLQPQPYTCARNACRSWHELWEMLDHEIMVAYLSICRAPS